MTGNRISLFLAGLLLSMGGSAGADIALRTPASVASKFTQPREVVKIFLLAVDRGELVVFDQKIDRSKITPLRVEYTYELDSPVPVVSVYSALKAPMPVPNHRDCEVHGVSAVLSTDGHIIETKAHVWTK
jgi:hypothetical protein